MSKPSPRSLAIPLAAVALALMDCARATQAPESSDLLQRAIAAAGGRETLERFSAFEWEGTAVVHIPGRDIAIAGRWRIQPPDRAVVTTYPVDQGPAGARRLILSGPVGWTQRGDDRLTPMPADLLAEERHQFYLYSILRLVPLLDTVFTVEASPRDSLGQAALRIHHPRHPDVLLYFDDAARIAAIKTVFAGPNTPTVDSQEIRLIGTVESEGVRWFEEMRILREGQPYFDLKLTELQALVRLDDSLLIEPQ